MPIAGNSIAGSDRRDVPGIGDEHGDGSSRPTPGPVSIAKAQNISRRCQPVFLRIATAQPASAGEAEQLQRIADQELVLVEERRAAAASAATSA